MTRHLLHHVPVVDVETVDPVSDLLSSVLKIPATASPSLWLNPPRADFS